ncbi:protein kinase, putative [Plasmodium chabaudi chabaudi]|uniref:non-specific serine/threonine protein kinase n=1 Tax=Plasmodium chabaudi chabaudi TaxID=31271 RepID=A0A4V0K1W3_PLACU|nr:protein kinase, putative [Plasmodium chabaudi chabaudi]VTZ66506.1 protein kinase, putative [Plasmodium chabaudi chabaudi]|eukprot:XP_016655562.1 protein kinase, putative [Plasmodium chabaudi chabaudi]
MEDLNVLEKENNKKKKKKKSRSSHKHNEKKNKDKNKICEKEFEQSYKEQIEEIVALNHIYFPIYVENPGHIKKHDIPTDLMSDDIFLKNSKELQSVVVIDMNDEIDTARCFKFCIFFNFDNDFPNYKVTFCYDNKYPYSFPNINICIDRILGEQEINFIILSIKKICAKNYGRIMLFDVCIFLNEHINKVYNDGFKNLWEEMRHREFDIDKEGKKKGNYNSEQKEKNSDNSIDNNSDGNNENNNNSKNGSNNYDEEEIFEASDEWDRTGIVEENMNMSGNENEITKSIKNNNTNKRHSINKDNNNDIKDYLEQDENRNNALYGGYEYFINMSEANKFSGFSFINSCTLNKNIKVSKKKKNKEKVNNTVTVEDELIQNYDLEIFEKKRMIKCEYNNIKNFNIIKKIPISYYKNMLIAKHIIDTNIYIIHTYTILNEIQFLAFYLNHILFCNRGFNLFCNILNSETENQKKKQQRKKCKKNEKMFRGFLYDLGVIKNVSRNEEEENSNSESIDNGYNVDMDDFLNQSLRNIKIQNSEFNNNEKKNEPKGTPEGSYTEMRAKGYATIYNYDKNKKKNNKIIDYSCVNYFCSEYQFYANKMCVVNKQNEKTLYDILKELDISRLKEIINHYKMVQKMNLKKIITELAKLSKIQHKYLFRYHISWLEKEYVQENDKTTQQSNVPKIIDFMTDFVLAAVGEFSDVYKKESAFASHKKCVPPKNARKGGEKNEKDVTTSVESVVDDKQSCGNSSSTSVESQSKKSKRNKKNKNMPILREIAETETTSANNGDTKKRRSSEDINPEINNLKKIKYIENLISKKEKNIYKVLYVQCEYCKGQLLEKEIENNLFQNNKYLIWNIFRQILEAINYLHKEKIYIKNLNTKNMYIDNDEYGSHIKIINYSVTNIIDYIYFYYYSYLENPDYFNTIFCDFKKYSYDKFNFESLFNYMKKIKNENTQTNNDTTNASKKGVDGERYEKNDFYIHSYNQYFYNLLNKKNPNFEELDIFSLGLILYELWHPPFKTKEEKFDNIKHMIEKRKFSDQFIKNINNDALKVLKFILINTINYENNETAKSLEYPQILSLNMNGYKKDRQGKGGSKTKNLKKNNENLLQQTNYIDNKNDNKKEDKLKNDFNETQKKDDLNVVTNFHPGQNCDIAVDNKNSVNVPNEKAHNLSDKVERKQSAAPNCILNFINGNNYFKTTQGDDKQGREIEKNENIEKITAERLLHSPLIPMVIQRDLFKYFLEKLKNNSPIECNNVINSLLYNTNSCNNKNSNMINHIVNKKHSFETNKNAKMYTNTRTYEYDIINSYIFEYFNDCLYKKFCTYNQPLVFQRTMKRDNTDFDNIIKKIELQNVKKSYIYTKKQEKNGNKIFCNNGEKNKIKKKIHNDSLDSVSKGISKKKKKKKKNENMNNSFDEHRLRNNVVLKTKDIKRVSKNGKKNLVDIDQEYKEDDHCNSFTTEKKKNENYSDRIMYEISNRFNKKIELIDKNNKLLYMPIYLSEGYINTLYNFPNNKNMVSSFIFFQNYFIQNNDQKIVKRENSILYTNMIVDNGHNIGASQNVKAQVFFKTPKMKSVNTNSVHENNNISSGDICSDVNLFFCVYQLIILYNVLDILHHFERYINKIIVRWSFSNFLFIIIKDMLSIECNDKVYYIYTKMEEGNMSYKGLKKLLHFLDINYNEQILKIMYSLVHVRDNRNIYNTSKDSLIIKMQKINKMYELKDHKNKSYINYLITNIIFLNNLFYHFNQNSNYIFVWDFFMNKYKEMFNFSFIFNILSYHENDQKLLSFGGVITNAFDNATPTDTKHTYNIFFEIFVDNISKAIFKNIPKAINESGSIDFHSPCVVITTKAYKLLVHAFSLYNNLIHNNIKCECKISPIVETSKFEQELLKYSHINMHVQINHKINTSPIVNPDHCENASENIIQNIPGQNNISIIYSTHILRLNIKKNFENELSVINYTKQLYSKR